MTETKPNGSALPAVDRLENLLLILTDEQARAEVVRDLREAATKHDSVLHEVHAAITKLQGERQDAEDYNDAQLAEIEAKTREFDANIARHASAVAAFEASVAETNTLHTRRIEKIMQREKDLEERGKAIVQGEADLKARQDELQDRVDRITKAMKDASA